MTQSNVSIVNPASLQNKSTETGKTEIKAGQETFYDKFMGRFGLTATDGTDWKSKLSEEGDGSSSRLTPPNVKNMTLSDMFGLAGQMFSSNAIGQDELSLLRFQMGNLSFGNEDSFMSSPLSMMANSGLISSGHAHFGFGTSAFGSLADSKTLNWISEYQEQLNHLTENGGSEQSIKSTRNALKALRSLHAQEGLFSALEISKDKKDANNFNAGYGLGDFGNGSSSGMFGSGLDVSSQLALMNMMNRT